jgi:outer membrane usher protein
MGNVAEQASYDVYLEVELNGHLVPLIALFHERAGRLAINGRDLNDVGIATDTLGVGDEQVVSLDTIPGLHYRYIPERQLVQITVPESLRKPFRFTTRNTEPVPAATASRGLLLNYDAFVQYDRSTQVALWNEARYFDPSGVFSTTGVARLGHHDSAYLRHDTSWSRSDPDTLRTLQVGDAISSSLEWTRSVRLGGVQWRSNFELRPDLVTFPVPDFAGSAVVPSSVDVYVNNIRRLSTDVPSGPFIVNDVPGINGAGMATVVARDALGRSVSSTLPLYIDRRLLASGLSSYSFEAGFMRRDYGLSSFDYSDRPAFSGSMRHGISDMVTAEAHAEATSGLYNVGVGALLRLGMAGVVNASVSGSTGRFAGTQFSLGYQSIQRQFTFDAQTTRSFGNYGDLAAREGAPVPKSMDRATVSVPLSARQTASLSYIGFAMPQAPTSRIASAAYSVTLGPRLAMNVSAYKDFGANKSKGVFLSLSIGMDNDVSVNANIGHQNAEATYNVNAIRSPSYHGGWGWGVHAGHASQGAYSQAQAQYLGNYGQLTAIAQQMDGRTSAGLTATGAAVLMDGNVQFARRVYDGFALVSTDGVADIPVLHENRTIGSTDKKGHLLIPDLNAYQHNRVAIDSMGLPVDTRVETTTLNVVPQAGSGVLARFPVSRYVAASLILHDAQGKALPVGARVHHVESGASTVVGYGGVTFIEGLLDENHLNVEYQGEQCTTQFAYQPDAGNALPTIGPLRCLNQEEDAV